MERTFENGFNRRTIMGTSFEGVENVAPSRDGMHETNGTPGHIGDVKDGALEGSSRGRGRVTREFAKAVFRLRTAKNAMVFLWAIRKTWLGL